MSLLRDFVPVLLSACVFLFSGSCLRARAPSTHHVCAFLQPPPPPPCARLPAFLPVCLLACLPTSVPGTMLKPALPLSTTCCLLWLWNRLLLGQGVIINGAIRDSAEIARMPFGCKALGTMPRKSEKRNPGGGPAVTAHRRVLFLPLFSILRFFGPFFFAFFFPSSFPRCLCARLVFRLGWRRSSSGHRVRLCRGRMRFCFSMGLRADPIVPTHFLPILQQQSEVVLSPSVCFPSVDPGGLGGGGGGEGGRGGL